MITAKQFAEAIQRPYTTVMGWLQAEIVPGAQLVETPIGSYYQIPANVVETFEPPKRGRPSKTIANGEVSTATDAPDDAIPAAVTGKKPAKKAGKKGNKKA